MVTEPSQNPPLPFSRTLLEEGERLFSSPGDTFSVRVAEERARFPHDPLKPPIGPPRPSAPDTEEALARRAVYGAVHGLPVKPSALCFSGGGIRSATFTLGVIQALARLHLLDKFDYLSTVSGGGYIGAWLTAWIHRLRKSGKSGVAAVQQALQLQDDAAERSRYSAAPPPLAWLREHSNYLTPQLGLFSADSWTMIGTALRNLLLNWLVLIPLLVASFMIPRLQIAWLAHFEGTGKAQLMLCLGLLLVIPALTYLHLYRPSFGKFRSTRAPFPGEQASGARRWNAESQSWFVVLCLVPLVAAAYCLTTGWAWYRNASGHLSAVAIPGWDARTTFMVVGAGAHFTGWGLAMGFLFLQSWWAGRRALLPSLLWGAVKEVLCIFLSGAAGGFALWAVLSQTPSGSTPSEISHLLVRHFAEWYAAFSVPGFLGLFLLVATFFIGLTGRFTSDQEHEFWGRTGAWILTAGTSIGVIGALIIFGPGLLAKAGAWTMASVGGAAGILSLVGGFSAKTFPKESEERDRTSRLLEYGVKLATPFFVVLLVVLLALGTSAVVKGWSSLLTGGDGLNWIETGRLMPEPDPGAPWIHSLALHNAQLHHLFALWTLLVSAGLVMGWGVNVNKFSLHGFYRNRLIRAYLGASRGVSADDARKPNPLTGFDPFDNVYMAELANYDFETERTETTKSVQKPFHIVNIALNLVRSDNLAWQQRKAQSCTVSPLHCGSWQDLGYRRSHEYGYNHAVNRAISLGTAIATSGAAASPNMGYHSSAAVTFLLALFNVRLGWWIGNPGHAGGRPVLGELGKRLNLWPSYRRACPAFSVGPLVAELFGFTNARRRYVYLSDGGHFENLGLYEMVLRRCRHIVVVDAGCDQELSFEDLGNAIRKIRIDQGVDIEIDLELLRRQGTACLSRWHHAIGTIRYDKVDEGAQAGTLIYLKPTLTGDEPSDVRDYAARFAAFPHELTSDQFFDESQFESYRRLGEHVAWEVFRYGMHDVDPTDGNDMLSRVVDRLEQHWIDVPTDVQESFLLETQSLLSLVGQTRTSPGAARDDVETYPEILSVLGMDPDTIGGQDVRSGLHVCYSKIRLMESVFVRARLAERYAHPLNRGWMNLFRRWAGAPGFRQWWPILCGTVTRAFAEFAERHLHLTVKDELVYQRRPLPEAALTPLRAQLALEWTADPSQADRLDAALRRPAPLAVASGATEPAVWLAWLKAAVSPVAALPFPDGELLGVMALSLEEGNVWQIHGWIKAGHQDLGIGDRLFERALADMQLAVNFGQAGRQTVIADLGPEDSSVSRDHQKTEWIRFYERLGFRRIPSAGPARIRLSRTLGKTT